MRVARRFVMVLGLGMVLGVPASASAATWTVSPTAAGPCDATARSCTTIQGAVTGAAAGDTIDVGSGAYAENVVVPTGKDGLVIDGTGGTAALANVTSASPTLDIQSDGVIVRKLAVVGTGAVPSAIRGAAESTSTGFTLDGDLVVCFNGCANSGLVDIEGGGTYTIRDSTIETNGTGADADAVYAHSPTGLPAPDKTLDVTSSVLFGGANAFGLRAKTENLLAGGITVTGSHVTIAGPAAAGASTTYGSVSIEAALNCLLLPTGPITATFSDSIVHGPTSSTGGGLVCTTVHTLTLGNSDTTHHESDVFVDAAHANFHLDQHSPDIDQGTDTPAAGAVDIDGQPRKVGSHTDLGADEYDNELPTKPAVTPSTTAATTGVNVGFYAAGATDPDGSYLSGGITSYAWTFGDGTTATTTLPGVAHIYTTHGTYMATVHAIDGYGGVGTESDPVTITVTDPVVVTPPGGGGGGGGGGGTPTATAPTLSIGAPADAATVHLYKKKRIKVKHHKKKQLRSVRVATVLKGHVEAPAGVRSVQLALLYLPSGHLPTSLNASCKWFNGKKSFKTKTCAQPTFFTANLIDFDWSFSLSSKLKLKSGTYALYARATDLTGLTSKSFSRTAGTLSVFRLKK